MLYFSTVSLILKKTLQILMSSEEFKPFILVGGTAISLQLGHRISVDIDLFTDSEYGSIDFKILEKKLQINFPYVNFSSETTAFGKSFFIGQNANECVKLDVFYSDPFIQKLILKENIRIASLEDLNAMKVEVIQNGGRKKDFWDLHELLEHFSPEEMILLHEKRYPYSHDRNLILKNFINFEIADYDLDVICLKGKYWDLIKSDFVQIFKDYK